MRLRDGPGRSCLATVGPDNDERFLSRPINPKKSHGAHETRSPDGDRIRSVARRSKRTVARGRLAGSFLTVATFDPFYRRLVRLSSDNPRRMLVEVAAMFWLLAACTLAAAALAITGLLHIRVLDGVGFALGGLCCVYLALRGTLRAAAWRDSGSDSTADADRHSTS